MVPTRRVPRQAPMIKKVKQKQWHTGGKHEGLKEKEGGIENIIKNNQEDVNDTEERKNTF